MTTRQQNVILIIFSLIYPIKLIHQLNYIKIHVVVTTPTYIPWPGTMGSPV